MQQEIKWQGRAVGDSAPVTITALLQATTFLGNKASWSGHHFFLNSFEEKKKKKKKGTEELIRFEKKQEEEKKKNRTHISGT